MKKVLVLGDLHYPREDGLFYKFLKLIEKEDPDYIFFCGDIINYANLGYLDRLLRKIHKHTETRVIGVMGNHDFWLSKGLIKRKLYSEDIIYLYKEIFQKYGDHLLWDEPYIEDSFAIVGVPGWYDFSLAPKHLNYNEEDYGRGWFFGFQWNDAIYVMFRASRMEFLELNLEMLKRQLDYVSKLGKKTYVLLHFVPLREFIRYRYDREDVWYAYAGTPKLGDLILQYPNIEHVFFGHINVRRLTSKTMIMRGTKFTNVDVSHGLESAEIIYI